MSKKAVIHPSNKRIPNVLDSPTLTNTLSVSRFRRKIVEVLAIENPNDSNFSMNQRARLPPTPNQQQNNSTHVSASSIRYQNIDVQNNSIADVSTDRVSAQNQIYNNNNISNDDTLNALGPDLALSTSQVIDSLTDHERSIILDVLSRDENIRQRDAARIL